jgi:nuclease HARBI1
MKYQTVDLPNGMNIHVWGPISVRHNDLVSLHESEINNKLVQLQAGEEHQWVIYGNSAYVHVDDSHILARHHHGEDNTERQDLENVALSACRECIEWDYGDVGVMWSMVDYIFFLKMQLMPVKNIYLTAMILRNAYVTMNGGTTSEYFNLIPPTFETWCRGGPANII